MRESNTLYLLSLLFKLFSLITSKTLTLNTFVIDNSFYIQYHKSLEEDVLFTQINQQLPFSWFNSKFLSKSAFKIKMNGDEKLINITIPPLQSNYSASIVSDSIIIDNVTIHHLLFYNVFIDNFSVVKNSFCFSFKQENPHFSMLHLLYENKQIDKLQYSISPYRGELYLGEVPEMAKEKIKYQSKCKIKNERWGCTLQGVYITNNLTYFYDNKEGSALFQFHEINIYCPKSFLSFFIQTVNENLSSTGQCIIEGNDNETYISCQITSFPLIKSLVFEIDNFTFFIPIDKLFSCSEYGCFSVFHYSNRFDYLGDNTWVLGSFFLLNYLTIYDYEDESVSFLSQYLDITSKVNYFYDTKSILVIIVFLVVIMIVMIILNLFIKIQNIR